MSKESHHIQAALVQMLENFQRCGVSRFGCVSASQLPAGWLDCLAELNRQPEYAERAETRLVNPRQTTSNASAGLPLPVGPPVTTLSSPPGDPPAGNLAPAANMAPAGNKASHGLSASVGGRAGLSSEEIPSRGRAAEPWSLPVLASEQQLRFDALAGQIRACRMCTAIVDYRQQTVFGDGPLCPTVCFMGEAPGADEDRTGKPFVGKAGQLLTKIINAMKLRREDVYILNALKCRPPQNRTPVNDEIDNCRHFVEEQLDTLQPKFIVCLGAVAVRSILQTDLPIGRLRGKFYQYRRARVVVTYHPSYLLRNESAKRLVWDDMKMLLAELSPA